MEAGPAVGRGEDLAPVTPLDARPGVIRAGPLDWMASQSAISNSAHLQFVNITAAEAMFREDVRGAAEGELFFKT
jgi:hypothetical protein